MQIAATLGIVGSPGFGWMPLAHSARTLPGVSLPSRVVRSIIRIARSRAHSFEAFLMLRFWSVATRSSAATWSTGVTRPSRLPRVPGRESHARTSACAWSRASVSRAAVAMGRRGYTGSRAGPDAPVDGSDPDPQRWDEPLAEASGSECGTGARATPGRPPAPSPRRVPGRPRGPAWPGRRGRPSPARRTMWRTDRWR